MSDGSLEVEGRRRGPYGFLFAAIIGIAGLVALGTWQLDRLAEKEALIAERKAMLVLPPLYLTRFTDVSAIIAYRRVTVTGQFLHDKELQVGPRSRRGSSGWQVVTPLRRADGGIVLIDRGWVPGNQKDPQSRLDGQVAGRMTVTGFVKRVTARGPFAPDNVATKGDWYWTDPGAIAAHLDLADVAPYWIVAARDGDRPVGPIGIDRVAMPVNNHLQYAITWYALAASLSVLALVYWRRARTGSV